MFGSLILRLVSIVDEDGLGSDWVPPWVGLVLRRQILRQTLGTPVPDACSTGSLSV